MTAKLAFIDCETTGLDRAKHDMWELAFYVREEDAKPGTEHFYHYLFDIDMGEADPTALSLTGYYDRLKELAQNDPNISDIVTVGNPRILSHTDMQPWEAALQVASALDGAHLVGAVTDFDAFFVEKFLRNNRQCPTWHYHLVCVENLVAGKFGIQPPWKSDQLAEELEVPKYPKRHRAAGDAEWAMKVYDKVMGLEP